MSNNTPIEIGFFHPDRGYWQAAIQPSAEIIAAYPDGTTQVALKPGDGYEYDGTDWVFIAPVVPEPTQEEIIAEYELELDNFLDSVALTYRYGVNGQIPPRYSLIVRTGFPNDDQQLAVAFGAWMDICNGIAKAKLNEVLAGHAAMPTKDEFIEMLPPFEAPV